jgi:hypothetical protein
MSRTNPEKSVAISTQFEANVITLINKYRNLRTQQMLYLLTDTRATGCINQLRVITLICSYSLNGSMLTERSS